MIVAKMRVYLKGANLRYAPDTNKNHRIGWKGLLGQTLAFWNIIYYEENNVF